MNADKWVSFRVSAKTVAQMDAIAAWLTGRPVQRQRRRSGPKSNRTEAVRVAVARLAEALERRRRDGDKK